ncbi:MAG TPA: alpha/beta fold hydrolase [Arachnia sp.]|nr:alpha/beta fold hydrolase [Arachnia sp.]
MKLNALTVGTGPRHVVFLHGLFGQGKNWGSIATALADVATCHLVDLPNHGLSPWTEAFDLDEQADLVVDWLRENVPTPVVLIGHSLGGKIAMRLALRHPELVDRLMVVDISPARNEAAQNFASLVAALRRLDLDHIASRGQAEQLLTPEIPDVVVRRFLLQNLRHRGEHWSWAANLDLLGDSLHEVGGWFPIHAVYAGPVVWVNGGRSPYVQPGHVEPMGALFPRVRQVTLKRAGHWVHADDPAAFVQVCRLFIQDAQPAG